MKRLDDFDSVFVNIVLSMMLSIVVMANFAPWTVLFNYEDTSDTFDRSLSDPEAASAAVVPAPPRATGNAAADPTQETRMTATVVRAERPKGAAVVADVTSPEID